MQKLINIIGVAVLCGILVKLSYVFIFLFGELDNGSVVSQITGVTFAFASVYFVVKVNSNTLKIVMVALDILTILYYYLHDIFTWKIEYSAFIVAAYSGLTVFFLGKIVAAQIDTQSTVDSLTIDNNRHTIDKQRLSIKNEIVKCKRRIRQSKTDFTRSENEKDLEILKQKLEKL
ncbi:MAG: hypothetical protein LBS50_09290 [Prevotellaceae bacterium]|jgi:hypothetical protein|nr:hypothetical protein [Prevotellaceae bacterium]